MPPRRRIGKLAPHLLREVVYPHLGAPRPEVLVGPQRGMDNAVIRVSANRVMIATTDPVSIIPALGLEDSAWLSVHLLASDVAASALAPAYALFDLNLPPHVTDGEFAVYWRAIHAECRRLGVAIVGGHSGRFVGCDYTVVGGATMFAVGAADRYVTAGMAQPGDVLLVTKGAAIAATGILARVFPETVEKAHGVRLLHRAQRYFRQITTVEDALVAASVGLHDEAVTALHDATEGGVLTALHELAAASHCGAHIQQDAIPLTREVRSVCGLFQLDPYFALSEGALVAAVRPHAVTKVQGALRQHGITSAVVGRVRPHRAGVRVRDAHGERVLSPPAVDPYWSVYARAAGQGWR